MTETLTAEAAVAVDGVAAPEGAASEARGVITEVTTVAGKHAEVKFRRPLDAEGRAAVHPRGWGRRDPNRWPPRVGDEIKINNGVEVVMTRRPPHPSRA